MEKFRNIPNDIKFNGYMFFRIYCWVPIRIAKFTVTDQRGKSGVGVMVARIIANVKRKELSVWIQC